MHKALLNEAVFYLTIKAEGPILVKSGIESGDPTRPDMEFVRTQHALLGETIFIPGSSIKGTLRSYSEKISRTLKVVCCDPFNGEHSCSKRLESLAKQSKSSEIYNRSCVACKLYGSTNLAGRAAFADAYPPTPIPITQLVKRTGVAIDRILGSVAVGPFDFEVLTGGAFRSTIRLRNFELWQLGLLGLSLRDLCLGRIRFGYGKSRGLGNVSATLDKLELRAISAHGLTRQSDMLTVKGIGGLMTEDERNRYGIMETLAVTFDSKSKPIEDLIGCTISFERKADSSDWCAPEVNALLGDCVKQAWTAYKDDHQVVRESDND